MEFNTRRHVLRAKCLISHAKSVYRSLQFYENLLVQLKVLDEIVANLHEATHYATLVSETTTCHTEKLDCINLAVEATGLAVSYSRHIGTDR
jgi:hypothetical protein